MSGVANPRLMASRLRTWRSSGHFARNVAILVGGAAAGQALVFASSPFLTRLYTPGDFGISAVFGSSIGIIALVASLRYDVAIPLPKQAEDGAALLVLSLGIVIATSALTALLVGVMGAAFLRWINVPGLGPYLWLIPMGTLMVGTYQALSYWAIRQRSFGSIARTRFYQGAGSSLTQLTLGFLGVGVLGLIVGQLIGQAAGVGLLAANAVKRTGAAFRFDRRTHLRHVAAAYKDFPRFASVAGLVNAAGLQLPLLLLAAVYDARIAGWFALGQRVIGLPMTILGTSVGQVYLAEASVLGTEKPRELKRLLQRTTRRLLLVGVAPILVVVVGGPALFTWVFGHAWSEVGWYARPLAVPFLLQFMMAPVAQTLNIVRRTNVQLGWETLRLLAVIGVFGLAHVLHWSDRTTIIIYSGTYGFLILVLFGVITWILNGLVSRGGGSGGTAV